MDLKFRCDCPITSALDILGDKWILVIIKLMLVEEKKTFKDFMESDEAIASNILAVKLKFLEEIGIVSKAKLPNNKKSNLYLLNESGLALAPIIAELTSWSDQYMREYHPSIVEGEGINLARKNTRHFAEFIQHNYRENVIKRLNYSQVGKEKV